MTRLQNLTKLVVNDYKHLNNKQMSLSRVRALDKNATKIRKIVADTIVNQTSPSVIAKSIGKRRVHWKPFVVTFVQ